eukprot:697990-Amphidinium_carterae.2
MDVALAALSNALIASRSCHFKTPSFTSIAGCIVAGLLTGFGLDFLAGQLSGPKVDRATLQLIGVLFASILLPGLARALVAAKWHSNRKMSKYACCSKEGMH